MAERNLPPRSQAAGPAFRAGNQAGFTLVELLAVLAIIGLLMGLSVMVFGGGQEKAYRAETVSRIAEIELLIASYEEKHGDYPTDRLKDLKVKVDNDSNEGIEACIACLYGKSHPTGRAMSDKALCNTDDDESSTEFRRDASRMLLEVADAWGNPIAYFHHRNYERMQTYLLSEPGERSEPDQLVEAVISPLTEIYANAQTYQLISAGSDEVFGTEDDIQNFRVDG